jgi:hypothetical protein
MARSCHAAPGAALALAQALLFRRVTGAVRGGWLEQMTT